MNIILKFIAFIFFFKLGSAPIETVPNPSTEEAPSIRNHREEQIAKRWDSYVNSKYSFTIQYPYMLGNNKISLLQEKNIFYIFGRNGLNIEFKIPLILGKNIESEDDIRKFIQEQYGKNCQLFPEYNKMVETNFVRLNTIVNTEKEGCSATPTSLLHYSPTEKKIVLIEKDQSPLIDLQDGQQTDYLSEMIGSFQFLDESKKLQKNHVTKNMSLAGKIQETEDYINEIDNNPFGYVVCKGGILGLSTEGASVISYYDSNALVKVAAIFFGENGKTEENIYLNNGNVVFIDSLTTEYDMPFYMEGSKNKSETESKYYFKNEVLTNWIEEGKEVDQKSQKFKEEADRFPGEFDDLGFNKLKEGVSCK
ncbi:hypothetical protein HZA38_06435 [Candidatus Peregrinibacteria bacterium]|nr:hypothetical protein [Candidatus Peregrinibacteria bacterium]